MFRNRMPRYEVLSEDAMATLDKGWRRLMSEIGVMAIFALSYNMLMGQAGLLSFGHAVLLGMGATFEKTRMGAHVQERVAFAQASDHYSSEVLAALAADSRTA